MTTFLLVRHGAHDLLGKVFAGRMPGVPLNEEGRRQAAEIGERLARRPVTAIASSPRHRALETAQPLAVRLGLQVRVVDEVDEVDVGEWTGLGFEALRDLGEPWREWCERRSLAVPPGGEPFRHVPQRAMHALRELHARHPDGTVAVFSHADVIKSVVAAVLRMSLDDLERFEIAPGSVTTLAMQGEWTQLKAIGA